MKSASTRLDSTPAKIAAIALLFSSASREIRFWDGRFNCASIEPEVELAAGLDSGRHTNAAMEATVSSAQCFYPIFIINKASK